jgi:hypothetical protein
MPSPPSAVSGDPELKQRQNARVLRARRALHLCCLQLTTRRRQQSLKHDQKGVLCALFLHDRTWLLHRSLSKHKALASLASLTPAKVPTLPGFCRARRRRKWLCRSRFEIEGQHLWPLNLQSSEDAASSPHLVTEPADLIPNSNKGQPRAFGP